MANKNPVLRLENLAPQIKPGQKLAKKERVLKRCNTRFYQEEWDMLAEIAESLGTNRSAWIREVMLREAKAHGFSEHK